MQKNALRLFLSIISLLLFSHMLSGADTGGNWKRELLSWRAQRAKNLQAPQGWLSLVGLNWLKPGDNTFGSARDNAINLPGGPAKLGVLRLNKDAVQLLPPPGGYPKGMLADGRAPANGQTLATDDTDHPTEIIAGTLAMVVIRRGDRLGLRTWDSRAPTLLHFHGLRWYDPNPALRVEARWVPYNPPRQIALATIIGTEEQVQVPGAAEFTLQGQQLRLEPVLESPGDKQLFFILRDATSKIDTYPASRFLYTEFPDHGLTQPGTLVIDFNRAQNPPCAYTAFATCPLPPKGNVLGVSIPGGEKRYHD
jgi:hypothetical protein